jgi:type IV pilus assembly protein PilB
MDPKKVLLLGNNEAADFPSGFSRKKPESRRDILFKQRKRISDILMEAGLISQHQLDHALMLQKSKHKRIGKILAELGYVTETQIAEALAQQLGLPFVDCSQYPITVEMKNLIPREMIQKKLVLPLHLEGRNLTLAMADPLDYETIGQITFLTDLNIRHVVACETNLTEATEKNFGAQENVWDLLKDMPKFEEVEFKKDSPEEEISVQSLYKSSEAPAIVKLVTMIIVDAIQSRASDIHIEPRERYVLVRYRVDGELRDILRVPKNIQSPVTSRIKIISNMDITNRRLPQDGNSYMKLGEKEVDLRISTLPSIYGEKVVMRLLNRNTGLIPVTQLGIPESILNQLIEIFSQPQGMLLVTGPTGGGKTTTLYAWLNQLRSETENIITVENPVEYKFDGITQVSVNDSVGYTFATALRSILRQDPDIIMVGEIRDLETAEIAIRAALTGHQVLSTLHTNDTVSTVTRLVDIGIPNFLVSSSVTGVLAQRLVRRICPKCKTEVDPPNNRIYKDLPPIEHYYQGKGCSHCYYTGYYGQVGVFEFLRINTQIRRLIAKTAYEDDLWDAARESGMKTLFEDAWDKVREGITTIEEVMAKIPEQFIEKMERARISEEKNKGILPSSQDRDPYSWQ